MNRWLSMFGDLTSYLNLSQFNAMPIRFLPIHPDRYYATVREEAAVLRS